MAAADVLGTGRRGVRRRAILSLGRRAVTAAAVDSEMLHIGLEPMCLGEAAREGLGRVDVRFGDRAAVSADQMQVFGGGRRVIGRPPVTEVGMAYELQ